MKLAGSTIPGTRVSFATALAVALTGLLAGSPVFAQAPQTPPQTPSAPPLPPAAPAARGEGDGGEAALRQLLRGTGGLTAAEAARRAAETSREVAARRANSAGAKAKEDQATAAFWPKLQGSARYTRLSALDPVILPGGILPVNPADQRPGPLNPGAPLIVTPGFPFPVFVNNGVLAASLSVPISDYLMRLSRALAAAERSTRAAIKEEDVARRKSAADARIAYYDWVRAKSQVLVTEVRLRAAQEQFRDLGRLFDAGFSSKADVLRGETQVTSFELIVTRARNGASIAEEALRIAMHDEGQTPYEIGEDMLAPPPEVAGLDDEVALRKEAVAKRPELVVLGETEKALRDLEALAKVGRYPRLDLNGSVAHANPNQRVFPPRQQWDMTWDASVVLSWTPSEIPLANATAREQAARANELVARREQLLDGIRLEVRQARNAVMEADSSIKTSRQALMAAAEGNRVRRELFRAGKATLLELIDSEAELTRARLEVVNAVVEARIARVRFEHAVGRDS
jgi:outer membrane protein